MNISLYYWKFHLWINNYFERAPHTNWVFHAKEEFSMRNIEQTKNKREKKTKNSLKYFPNSLANASTIRLQTEGISKELKFHNDVGFFLSFTAKMEQHWYSVFFSSISRDIKYSSEENPYKTAVSFGMAKKKPTQRLKKPNWINEP